MYKVTLSTEREKEKKVLWRRIYVIYWTYCHHYSQLSAVVFVSLLFVALLSPKCRFLPWFHIIFFSPSFLLLILVLHIIPFLLPSPYAALLFFLFILFFVPHGTYSHPSLPRLPPSNSSHAIIFLQHSSYFCFTNSYFLIIFPPVVDQLILSKAFLLSHVLRFLPFLLLLLLLYFSQLFLFVMYS